jgi:ATP-dependent Lon protease
VTDPSVIEILPVLPLKNTVLFPYLLLPLSITKPSAMAAVDAALARADKGLVVVAQRSSATMKAQDQSDLHAVGTKAVVMKKSDEQQDGLEVILLGIERSVILTLEQADSYLQGRIRPLAVPETKSAEVDALYRELLQMAEKVLGKTEVKGVRDINHLPRIAVGFSE